MCVCRVPCALCVCASTTQSDAPSAAPTQTNHTQVIRTFEFYTGRPARPYRFDVIITTYELVLKDASTLGKIRWDYMLMDEAHRLKNADSALYNVRLSCACVRACCVRACVRAVCACPSCCML